jgi:hypothetical protein
MAKGMTIKEVKTLRTNLEADIMKLVKEFQSATGVQVSYIDMKWQYKGDKNSIAVPVESPEKRTLKDVGVNIDFDAIGA